MTFYCQACGQHLTRAEADYHRSECHAFVDQTRDDIAEEKRQRESNARYDPARAFGSAWDAAVTAEPDEPHEQSSQDERP